MIEQKHCCAVCKRNTIKLYRYYACFLRDEEIFCRAHAPPGHIEHQNLVPLIEDEDGSVWGYTSVPPDAIARWEVLPDEEGTAMPLDLEPIRSRWSRLQHTSEDLAALIQEVERLRAEHAATEAELDHASNQYDRLSYESRTEIERLRGFHDLIRQIEARGWLWECGHRQGPHEPDRHYYAYLWLPTFDPMHEDYVDEREGDGATVEEALRQAIAALPPDRREL